MGTELLLVFFCYPFIVHGIYSDVPPFISDISNLCLLSFFFVSLARGFLFYRSFQRNNSWFCWFFSIDFLFSAACVLIMDLLLSIWGFLRVNPFHSLSPSLHICRMRVLITIPIPELVWGHMSNVNPHSLFQ